VSDGIATAVSPGKVGEKRSIEALVDQSVTVNRDVVATPDAFDVLVLASGVSGFTAGGDPGDADGGEVPSCGGGDEGPTLGEGRDKSVTEEEGLVDGGSVFMMRLRFALLGFGMVFSGAGVSNSRSNRPFGSNPIRMKVLAPCTAAIRIFNARRSIGNTFSVSPT